jgi:hypothetical protein
MEAIVRDLDTLEPIYPGTTTIKTSLYELIEAISEEVKPGEDELVAETVLHLFETGQAKFINGPIDLVNS